MTKNTTLLSENQLIWSPIVANNRMNRERQASGINSYALEIGFSPETWLKQRLTKQSQVSWLDVCCGQGNALLQVAQSLEKGQFQKHAYFHGIDLVSFFTPLPPNLTCIHFEINSIISWQPVRQYDFITCIHGLHYVGDKLLAIKKMAEAIAPQGCLRAHLDLQSIFVNNQVAAPMVKQWLNRAGITYDEQKKLIRLNQLPSDFPEFPGKYLGADDQAGKNYTGQEAVNAHYII